MVGTSFAPRRPSAETLIVLHVDISGTYGEEATFLRLVEPPLVGGLLGFEPASPRLGMAPARRAQPSPAYIFCPPLGTFWNLLCKQPKHPMHELWSGGPSNPPGDQAGP